MSSKLYGVADENNGIFETYQTAGEAEAAFERWVQHVIGCEKEIQAETGFSDAEIEARARAFYSVVEIKTTGQLRGALADHLVRIARGEKVAAKEVKKLIGFAKQVNKKLEAEIKKGGAASKGGQN